MTSDTGARWAPTLQEQAEHADGAIAEAVAAERARAAQAVREIVEQHEYVCGEAGRLGHEDASARHALAAATARECLAAVEAQR